MSAQSAMRSAGQSCSKPVDKGLGPPTDRLPFIPSPHIRSFRAPGRRPAGTTRRAAPAPVVRRTFWRDIPRLLDHRPRISRRRTHGSSFSLVVDRLHPSIRLQAGHHKSGPSRRRLSVLLGLFSPGGDLALREGLGSCHRGDLANAGVSHRPSDLNSGHAGSVPSPVPAHAQQGRPTCRPNGNQPCDLIAAFDCLSE